MADAPADLEIRLLRPGDDPEAQLDLSERAFGPGSGADRDRRVRSLSRLVAGGRYLGAFVGGSPAAAAAFQDMRQWWRGRPVPMAGVSSVKVAPEFRGRGIGRLLMTALLDEISARGYPLSALFPATCRCTGRWAGNWPGPGTPRSSRPGRCSAWSRPTPVWYRAIRTPRRLPSSAGPAPATRPR